MQKVKTRTLGGQTFTFVGYEQVRRLFEKVMVERWRCDGCLSCGEPFEWVRGKVSHGQFSLKRRCDGCGSGLKRKRAK